jgi:PBSX family phage terminase large subunit
MQTEFQLTPKQAEYIQKANHRWNFAVGAVRSGKSHLAVLYTIPHGLLSRKGMKGLNLILGASKENIERNVLEPMRSIWGNSLISDINVRNWATIFGEKVYCIGAEKVNQVTKLRGSEIKFCYCDEICDINKEVFEMLKSRLSLPYSICHAACNPSYPTHFVKEFIDSADKGVDIYTQEYTIYDNPFLPKEYVKSLEAEYSGTVYYLRYILGKWARAEGLIFPMYVNAMEDPPEESRASDYALSIDYGTQNAFAALLWEKHRDIWYATRGYYYSGRDTGVQKTDEEYADDLEYFLSDLIEEYVDGVAMFKKDPYMHDLPSKIQTIIDPSAASFIALMKKRDWCKIRGADNDVLNGIRETASAMNRGLIKISPSIKMWKKEVEGYVWDDSIDERPVKVDDHFMDSTRYFVKTKKIAKVKRSVQ